MWHFQQQELRNAGKVVADLGGAGAVSRVARVRSRAGWTPLTLGLTVECQGQWPVRER